MKQLKEKFESNNFKAMRAYHRYIIVHVWGNSETLIGAYNMETKRVSLQFSVQDGNSLTITLFNELAELINKIDKQK